MSHESAEKNMREEFRFAKPLKILCMLLISVALLWQLGFIDISGSLFQSRLESEAEIDALFLENLTWLEIRERQQKGALTVIVPTGGTEQNGLHMTLAKHNKIVRYNAGQIALRFGQTLVAPVIKYVPEGPPDQRQGHMAFHGTLSVRPETFARLLEDTATSLKTHGFRCIVFLGDSGGNQQTQAAVAKALNDDWQAEGVQVLHIADYYQPKARAELLQNQSISAADIGTHAGVIDTSELLAVAPEHVDLEKIKQGQLLLNQAANQETTQRTQRGSGSNGRPELASARLGRQLVELKIQAALKAIEQLHFRTKRAKKD